MRIIAVVVDGISRFCNARVSRFVLHGMAWMLPSDCAMRTHKKQSSSSKLFSHREDEAFVSLVNLETILARMFPARGSRWLRERLHKTSARLAEVILMSIAADDLRELAGRVRPALRLCKVIDGLLTLLKAYGVLTESEYEEAMKLAVRLTRAVARRFFGIDSDGSDGTPSSSGAAVSPAAMPNGGLDIAAQPPPLFS